jgi:hypothetical protein
VGIVIGSPAATAGAASSGGGSNVQIPGTVPAAPARGSQGNAGSSGSVVWWLALVGLYILWALLHSHQRVREAVKPENVRVNAHNIAVIVLAVLIGIPILKVALAKVSVWVPFSKPFLQPLLQLVGSA